MSALLPELPQEPSASAGPKRRDISLKRVVDALKPGITGYRIWDTELPGFGLRIAPSGRKSYFVQYRAKGVSRRMYIGDTRTVPPQAARKAALEVLATVARGQDPLNERRQSQAEGRAAARARREAATVTEIAERYLETLSLTKSTKWSTEARRLYEVHIAPVFGTQKVADIDTPDVRRLHEKMHATPALANRVRAVLSAIFTRAMADGARPKGTNPCEGIQPFDETPRDRYLNADEWRRLAKAMTQERAALADVPPSDTRPLQLDAILLLALTGGRKEAITQRRWRDVDWEARVLRVDPAHKGTTRIYLGEATLAILRLWHAQRGKESAFLFPGQRRRLGERKTKGKRDTRPKRSATHISTIRPVWESLCQRAKLENIRPHDLRRSFATVAGDVGVSEHIIGGLLSHVVHGVTGVYAHRTDPALVEAANRTAAKVAQRLCLNGIEDHSILPLRTGTSF